VHGVCLLQAVLFTETKVSEAIRWNEYCHAHSPPIPFVRADVRGLFGTVFCDFGPSFIVSDLDGKRIRQFRSISTLRMDRDGGSDILAFLNEKPHSYSRAKCSLNVAKIFLSCANYCLSGAHRS
jgi:hypothetical protein